jgi:hypothetical protein
VQVDHDNCHDGNGRHDQIRQLLHALEH